jgi:hypothetical protein
MKLEPNPALVDALEQDALCQKAHAPIEVEFPTIGPDSMLDCLRISRQQRATKTVLLIDDGFVKIGVVWPRRPSLHARIRPGVGHKLQEDPGNSAAGLESAPQSWL